MTKMRKRCEQGKSMDDKIKKNNVNKKMWMT